MVMESALAKIRRAEEHRTLIERAIHAWIMQNPNPVAIHNNDKMTQVQARVNWNAPPPLTHWALQAGDCVHALRSALDHTLYEIAQFEHLPDWKGEFPIFDTEEGFQGERGFEWKLGLRKTKTNVKALAIANPKVRAILTRIQPWHDPARVNEHNLWHIHTLDVIDKHRTLNLVPFVYRGTNISTDPAVPFVLSEKSPRPLENDALLFTVTFAQPEEVTVNVGGEFGVLLPMNDGREIPLLTTLYSLCQYTRGVVHEIRDLFV